MWACRIGDISETMMLTITSVATFPFLIRARDSWRVTAELSVFSLGRGQEEPVPDGMVISMKLWFVRRGEACLHAEGVTTKMRTVTEVARTLDYLSDGGKQITLD